jgi:hypothetical protein
MVIKFHVFEESLDGTVVSFSDGLVILLNREENTDIGKSNILGVIMAISFMFDLQLNVKMFTHQGVF